MEAANEALKLIAQAKDAINQHMELRDRSYMRLVKALDYLEQATDKLAEVTRGT